MRNSIQLLNRRNLVILKIEKNCPYVNVGLLLFFLYNLCSLRGHFIRLAARCLYGAVFQLSTPSDSVQSQLSTLPHQRTAHRFTMKAPNPQSIDKGFSSYSSQMNMSTIVLRLHSAQGGTDSCRNARMHAVPRFSTENT